MTQKETKVSPNWARPLRKHNPKQCNDFGGWDRHTRDCEHSDARGWYPVCSDAAKRMLERGFRAPSAHRACSSSEFGHTARKHYCTPLKWFRMPPSCLKVPSLELSGEPINTCPHTQETAASEQIPCRRPTMMASRWGTFCDMGKHMHAPER